MYNGNSTYAGSTSSDVTVTVGSPGSTSTTTTLSFVPRVGLNKRVGHRHRQPKAGSDFDAASGNRTIAIVVNQKK